MQTEKVITHIVSWLKEYSDKSGTEGFVIGISGGIDSALTSALCARTNKKIICLNMPLHQNKDEYNRGHDHIQWLKKNFSNVAEQEIDLTATFESLKSAMGEKVQNDWLALANTRSRLRMATLYAVAGANKMLVAGTGNKVEDFGVGFFTKWGDGGVDLSPIADLMKSEVYALAKALGIIESIQKAAPSDGLWEDGRSDEDQIGATYDELEWAMQFLASPGNFSDLNHREREVLDIYERFHKANLHKMKAIPVCDIPDNFRN